MFRQVSLNGQVRLLKLSATAEAVAQRLRSKPISEEGEEQGILASLGQIVKFRKEEFTYLQELWDHHSTLATKPKASGVELQPFMEIMYMFCKRSTKDSTKDDGGPDGRKRRSRGVGEGEGGDKKSNFLLERIFTVFEKRNDEVSQSWNGCRESISTEHAIPL